MTIIRFPYDAQTTQLSHGRVHLARSEVRFAVHPIGNVYVAVDFDGAQPFPFRNTILQESLLPLLKRVSSARTMPIDVVVEQQTYTRVPSLLLDLRVESAQSRPSPGVRVRVFFSQAILKNHFGLFADCHGVFGRSDFPADVTCSSTMTDFVVNWL